MAMALNLTSASGSPGDKPITRSIFLDSVDILSLYTKYLQQTRKKGDSEPMTATPFKVKNGLIIGDSTTQLNSVLDEDNMASDSATALATQQSIKAYVDTAIGALSSTAISEGNSSATIADSGSGTLTVSMDGSTVGVFNSSGLTMTGSILPSADTTYDLGSASFQWQNIYTGDLHLNNEQRHSGNAVDGTRGNWTVQEGAEDLYIINNNTGKKYKFSLVEMGE